MRKLRGFVVQARSMYVVQSCEKSDRARLREFCWGLPEHFFLSVRSIVEFSVVFITPILARLSA